MEARCPTQDRRGPRKDRQSKGRNLSLRISAFNFPHLSGSTNQRSEEDTVTKGGQLSAVGDRFSPHTPGGGLMLSWGSGLPAGFSPRAWGWTAGGIGRQDDVDLRSPKLFAID